MSNAIENKDIDALNDLIEITLDSADGYETAAKNATDSRLRQLFTRRGLERRQVVHDLQDHVRRLGGKAEDEGSILAKAHRYFLDIRTSVAGNEDLAVVDEVERGEDQIKARYEKSLRDGELSPDARRLVEHAFISVKRGHDQVSAIKHAVH